MEVDYSLLTWVLTACMHPRDPSEKRRALDIAVEVYERIERSSLKGKNGDHHLYMFQVYVELGGTKDQIRSMYNVCREHGLLRDKRIQRALKRVSFLSGRDLK